MLRGKFPQVSSLIENRVCRRVHIFIVLSLDEFMEKNIVAQQHSPTKQAKNGQVASAE